MKFLNDASPQALLFSCLDTVVNLPVPPVLLEAEVIPAPFKVTSINCALSSKEPNNILLDSFCLPVALAIICAGCVITFVTPEDNILNCSSAITLTVHAGLNKTNGLNKAP